MAKTIIITGASRGLGKAIFQQLSSRQGIELITLSRNPPEGDGGKAHTHFSADFNNLNQLQETLSQLTGHLSGKDDIVFISNAGDVKPVKRTGSFLQEEIIQSLHINYTAPVMIANGLLSLNKKTSLVNISSGAASKPVDGWALYCSSKAAAKAFFDVVAKEYPDNKVAQVNPGVIDTEMQQEIRNASADDFSRLEEFIEYKNSNTLQTPNAAAEKIITQLTEQGIL